MRPRSAGGRGGPGGSGRAQGGREQALAALLADVLSADQPPAELVARYVQDPGCLSPAEREVIGQHLESTPGFRESVAAQRRVLAGEGWAGKDGGRRSSDARAAVPARRGARMWIRLATPTALLASVGVGLELIDTGSGSRPGSPAAPAARSGALERSPLVAPVAALAAPEYRRPADAAARARLTSSSRSDAGSRAPRVEVLAPEHVGRTSSATPDLAWYVAPLPAEGAVELAIWEEGGEAERLRSSLPWPTRPGVQLTSLARLGVSLELGRLYRWRVQLREDPGSARAFAMAEGSIQRVPEGSGVPALESVAERSARYAREGLWYDALAGVLEARRAGAADPWAERALGALLRSAGLEGLEVSPAR